MDIDNSLNRFPLREESTIFCCFGNYARYKIVDNWPMKQGEGLAWTRSLKHGKSEESLSKF